MPDADQLLALRIVIRRLGVVALRAGSRAVFDDAQHLPASMIATCFYLVNASPVFRASCYIFAHCAADVSVSDSAQSPSLPSAAPHDTLIGTLKPPPVR